MRFILWIIFLAVVTAAVAALGRHFFGWDETMSLRTMAALIAAAGFTALQRTSKPRVLVLGLLCVAFGMIVGFADPFSTRGILLWLVLVLATCPIIADRMNGLPRDERPHYPRTLLIGTLGGVTIFTLLEPFWREYESQRFLEMAAAGIIFILAGFLHSRSENP